MRTSRLFSVCVVWNEKCERSYDSGSRGGFMTTKNFRWALAFTVLLSCVSYGPSAFADVTHDYELNGSYSDVNGGPPATNNGGDLTTNPGFYTFAANQGLVLDKSVILGGTYDIQVSVGFTATGANGWTKIADFTGLGLDQGWYI